MKDAHFRTAWVAWPKGGRKSATGLTQQDVRRAGLATGFVDYKICAIDDKWAALAFTRRRKQGGGLSPAVLRSPQG